jgi:hypothetical protein
MKEYHGDSREQTREKLTKGTASLKDLTRKRTYLQRVLEKKLERQVELSMWMKTHKLQGKKEAAMAAKRDLIRARRDLLREVCSCFSYLFSFFRGGEGAAGVLFLLFVRCVVVDSIIVTATLTII